jgi:hypothetical protein
MAVVKFPAKQNFASSLSTSSVKYSRNSSLNSLQAPPSLTTLQGDQLQGLINRLGKLTPTAVDLVLDIGDRVLLIFRV